MSESTNISWANSTASPWFGCTEVSPGCANCYARELTLKYKWSGWGDRSPRVKAKSFWKDIPKWNKAQQKWKDQPCDPRFRPVVDQHPNPRIFPSLMDWLDPMVPVEWLADFLRIIDETPNLDWLLLTKRPEQFRDRVYRAKVHAELNSNWPVTHFVFGWFNNQPPPNVWIGVTVEDQKRADERIPELLKIPAKVRWLSVEPLLESIEFSDVSHRSDCVSQLGKQALNGIDWVVVGGESGSKRRDCGWEAINSVVIQCRSAGVPVWVKQDCAMRPGQQGRLPDELWNLKQLPL